MSDNTDRFKEDDVSIAADGSSYYNRTLTPSTNITGTFAPMWPFLAADNEMTGAIPTTNPRFPDYDNFTNLGMKS